MQLLRWFSKNSKDNNHNNERTPLLINAIKENAHNNSITIERLNKDILIYIFSFLSLEDVSALSLTCKTLFKLINEDFWKYLGNEISRNNPELTKNKLQKYRFEKILKDDPNTLFGRYSMWKNNSIQIKQEIHLSHKHNNGLLCWLSSVLFIVFGSGIYALALLYKAPEYLVVGIMIAALSVLANCFSYPCIYKDYKKNSIQSHKLTLLKQNDHNLSKKLLLIESFFPDEIKNENIAVNRPLEELKV